VIDTTTLTESTFSLTYPAPTQIINAQQLITGPSRPSTVSLSGTWSFTTDDRSARLRPSHLKVLSAEHGLYRHAARRQRLADHRGAQEPRRRGTGFVYSRGAGSTPTSPSSSRSCSPDPSLLMRPGLFVLCHHSTSRAVPCLVEPETPSARPLPPVFSLKSPVEPPRGNDLDARSSWPVMHPQIEVGTKCRK
jgi:hypothetical protein